MDKNANVYIVDDDEELRASLVTLLSLRTPWQIMPFATGEEWLNAEHRLEPGCVLLDYSMPGISGLGVLEQMRKAQSAHQTIMLTGEGNISIAVQAMHAGASDFIEKPVAFEALEKAVSAALERLGSEMTARLAAQEAKRLIERLTPRERDVMLSLADGLPNKVIANRMGLSVRTVEVYRANLMDKLEVKSLADVIKLVFGAGLMRA